MSFSANAATVYGLRCVDGYDSIFPSSYRAHAAHLEGADPSPLANGNMLLLGNGKAWMGQSASLAVQPTVAPVPEWSKPLWRGDACSVVAPTLQRWPRMYTVSEFPLLPTPLTANLDELNAIRLDLPDTQPYAPLVVADALDGQWQALSQGGQRLQLRTVAATAWVGVPPGTRRLT